MRLTVHFSMASTLELASPLEQRPGENLQPGRPVGTFASRYGDATSKSREKEKEEEHTG